MEAYITTYNTVITILSAVITGGFVLILVEIGNRKNRESDRYRQTMTPFVQKLSAYLRYICWIKPHIVNPKPINEDEKLFLFIVHNFGVNGSDLLESGGNFEINSFTAKDLEHFCNNINHIWYMYDRRWLDRFKWEEADSTYQELIDKELAQINPRYLSMPEGLGKIAKISGEFYTDIFMPIQDEPYSHEASSKLYNIQTWIVSASLFFVLLCLGLLVCYTWPIWLLKVTTISVIMLFGFCMLLLLVNENKQLYCLYRIREFRKAFKRKKHKVSRV